LLEAKLRAEGLFDESRKRPLPYPPRRVGLITSGESAAYHDFTKIMNERWGGVEIELADVQVQGESSPGQIIFALEYFNSRENPVDVIIMTRGGGSPEDLAAFSTELVTRAVAASRIPTLVAIGHEVDVSLAELAADKRASTPSNAAQLLVPDKRHVLEQLEETKSRLGDYLQRNVTDTQAALTANVSELNDQTAQMLDDRKRHLSLKHQVLVALSPTAALQRGYAIVTKSGKAIKSAKYLKAGDTIMIRMHDGSIGAEVQ
jgi:exodeoxyribonuclease VII large subunit